MAYDASSIHVLEGLEAVRVRPAMYIGSTNVKGLNHLVYEIVDNSVDEACNGYGSNVYVCLNEDGSCTVKDEGRGIPVDVHESGVSALRVVLTTLHAGGKFDNNSYKTSGGLHGVGSSVVNALSETFSVSVARDGKLYTDTYEKGKPVTTLNEDGTLPCVPCDSNLSGTTITFKPDSSIFSTVEFKASDIKQRLHETAYLNPGLTFFFSDRRKDSQEEATYHEPNGVVQYLLDMNQEETSVNDPYFFKGSFEGDKGAVEVSVAFQWVESLQEKIIGYCNNIQTAEGGSHVTALKTVVTNVVNSYARELGVLKEKDSNFTGPDVRSGFCCVVSVRHPDPQFEGQTKTKLDNSDAYKAVSSVCSKELQLYFDRNLPTLKKVLAIAEKSAKVRKAEAKTRQNLFTQRKKYSFDSNGKLAGCESRDYSKTELFVVEGDSAAGSGKMARNRKYQAILPIRGKILNVEKASVDKILANAEIKALIYALGCGFSEGYGQDFDISKLKYDKVILMTDSDSDGSHIVTLLLTILYRLLPELIYQGHVYIACPPLYKVIPNRGKESYLYTDEDLEKYRKSHSNFRLQRYKGLGEMNPSQLWETTMNPETRLLKKVSISNDSTANSITSKLMGTSAELRKRFIFEHAKEANLDV